MHYKNLGRTGLKVSAVGLGCGNFGGIGSAPAFFGRGETEQEAFAIMDAAWDMGINFFDTADAYGGGRSESYIGAWLKGKGSAARDQLLLSSKLFNPVGDGPNDRGLSRRQVVRQVDASLCRLGVEHLDMYLIHEPDAGTPLDETLRALDDMVHQGKLRYLGASNMPAWLMTKALWISDKYLLHRFEWVQNSYSLLDRADERELFPLCQDQALGYTPFSPLAGGWLTGKYRRGEPLPAGSRMTLRPEGSEGYRTDATFDALEAFERAASGRGVSMAALAIAWLLHLPEITAVVVGPSRLQHLAPVSEALGITLDDDERDALEGIFR
jgi:aryl-alcohol dehydrogenase-like predicted oxidoreductase